MKAITKLNKRLETAETKLLESNRRLSKEMKTVHSADPRDLINIMMSSRKSRRWLKRQLKLEAKKAKK